MTERTTNERKADEWPLMCEEGHPLTKDALYCQTCRDLYIHWAYGLNAVQHAALGRALDPDSQATERQEVA